MYLIGALQVSRRNVQTLLSQWGCDISLGALTDMQHVTTAAMAQPYQEICDVVRAAPRLNADETSWRQKKARRWVWSACCATAALYKIQDGRNTACAQALLGDNQDECIVTTDRLGSYSWIGGERQQYCWAHMKRDFKAIEERSDRKASKLGAALGTLTKRLFRYRHRYKAGKKSASWFKTMIRGEIKPKMMELLKKGEATEDKKTRGTCKALLKGWESLWTFTQAQGVEPTNNEAERAMRRVVTWRKLSGGTQNEGGAAFVERMLSCVATVKRNQASVLAFLTALIASVFARQPPPSVLNPA
jgi:transposase